MRKPPFTVIDEPDFTNTADALTWLNYKHNDKEIIGFACIVMLKGREVILHSTGELNRNPDYARGLCQRLNDRFYQMITART